MHRFVLAEPLMRRCAEVVIGFILGEACVGEGGVGEIRIRVVRIGEALLGEFRLRVGLTREDAIGETGVLEGSVRLRLVGRRRLGARRHRSLTARLDRGLRLVALRLRLAWIGLRREGIWEIRGGVVSRRGAWSLVGWRRAILVRIARYPGHLGALRLSALTRIRAVVRLGRLRQMLRLRLWSSCDRLIGGHLRKNRPTAGSENRALSRLARSTCS